MPQLRHYIKKSIVYPQTLPWRIIKRLSCKEDQLIILNGSIIKLEKKCLSNSFFKKEYPKNKRHIQISQSIKLFQILTLLNNKRQDHTHIITILKLLSRSEEPFTEIHLTFYNKIKIFLTIREGKSKSIFFYNI